MKLGALLVAAALAGQAHAVDLVVDGRPRHYELFLPAGKDGAMPLLLLLHGTGGRGAPILSRWTALAQAEGFAVVAPDSVRMDGWHLPDDGPELQRAIVEDVARRHPVDLQRLYLFGHSAGGQFSIRLALMESEFFAAAASHGAAWLEASEYSAPALARRKVPLAMFIGDRDEYFPLPAARETARALRAAGFPVEFNLMRRHSHDYWTVSSRVNPKAWSALRRHALDAAPRWRQYRFGADGVADATGPAG